jgi:hypothetical protein
MYLSLYFSGPKAYNMFSKTFKLLSKRTRQRITKNIKFSPGFQQQVFDILKIKASTLWFIRIHIFNFLPHRFINLMNWMGTVLFVLMKLAFSIFYFTNPLACSSATADLNKALKDLNGSVEGVKHNVEVEENKYNGSLDVSQRSSVKVS